MSKSLICITTSRRPHAVRAFLAEYIDFSARSPDYELAVSIDGPDQATEEFCRRHRVPYLVSVHREGVGLSKNRVLRSFPDVDDYFFIDDDVQLLDGSVFDAHREASRALKLPHLSLGPRRRYLEPLGVIEGEGVRVLGYRYGSGAFNYFTRQGLQAVGGFHTHFAQFRRYGHSEHSYRFVNAGLSPYPFCVVERCFDGHIKVLDPPSVTRLREQRTEGYLSVHERRIMDLKLSYFPPTVLSDYSVIHPDEPVPALRPASAALYRAAFLLRLAPLTLFRMARNTATLLVKRAGWS